MISRDRNESHRVATPLELLFDLCFVVAVAQAAASLHHGVAEAHFGEAILGYAMVFFSLWWAWMNFTWFASAFDTDDVPYRLAVLVQIAGALVIAAGVPRASGAKDFTIVTIGYAIMRVGLIANWLRAASANGPHRQTAIRYALGLAACQVGWIGLLALPADMRLLGFLILVPCELLVPVVAERAEQTPWHPHHIAERYGLLTLIVLGESVLSATVAVQSAVDAGSHSFELGGLAIGGLLILFSMWWIYFDHPAHAAFVEGQSPFVWGYGHLLVFAATAAVGAGLAVAADAATGHAHVSPRVAGTAVAIPVALYVLCVWALQIRHARKGAVPTAAFLLATALVLATPFVGWTVLLVGLLLSALVAVTIATGPVRHHE